MNRATPILPVLPRLEQFGLNSEENPSGFFLLTLPRTFHADEGLQIQCLRYEYLHFFLFSLMTPCDPPHRTSSLPPPSHCITAFPIVVDVREHVVRSRHRLQHKQLEVAMRTMHF